MTKKRVREFALIIALWWIFISMAMEHMVHTAESDKRLSERSCVHQNLMEDIHQHRYGMRLQVGGAESDKIASKRGCSYQSLMDDIHQHRYGMRLQVGGAKGDKKAN